MIKIEFGIQIAEFGIFIPIRHSAFNIPHFIDTLPFNPRTLALEDFAQLYQAAFKERAWGSASAKS